MNNIVFLGIDLEYSMIAANLLKEMDCNILVSHNKREKLHTFPDTYDLGIAFMYRNLVPKEELKKARWINIHPAPLPEYGGRNVAYHAILNKEKIFGTTMHYMDEQFDKGEIISTIEFDIPDDATAKELYDLTCKMSIDLIKKYLPQVLSGKELKSRKQKNHTYYKQQKMNDFINIDDDSKRMIRALYSPPYYPKIKIGGRTFNIILEE